MKSLRKGIVSPSIFCEGDIHPSCCCCPYCCCCSAASNREGPGLVGSGLAGSGFDWEEEWTRQQRQRVKRVART